MYSRVVLAVLLFLCALPWATGADEPKYQSAAVKVANRTVVVLRGPIAGYTADERAEGAQRRIEGILETDPRAAVSFEPYDIAGDATRVKLGGKHVFLITPIDIDKEAGETTQLVAQEAGKRLQQAAAEWNERASPRHLTLDIAMALGATAIYILLLWLLFRGSRWLGQRLSDAAEKKARAHVGSVRLVMQRMFYVASWTLAIPATASWLAFVLERFPYTRTWGENLEDNLLQLAKHVVLAIAEAMPGLLLVAIIFFLARMLIGFARTFFDRVETHRTQVGWLAPDVVPPTRRIVSVAIWIFALAMAYPYLPGAQTEAFKGLSVLVGLMATLGGASIVGQAFSGMILMYTRVLQRGDYVRIGESEGTVIDLGMFATRIRTGLGEEITLANSNILSSTTRNYSRAVPGTGYVIDTVVTIGYGTPWRQVHAMLEEAARRVKDIAQLPAPVVRQTALSDYYVEYRLIAYTPLENPVPRVDVLSRLHTSIQDVFNEYGVQIMSPHYMMDPGQPQIVPKEQWYAAPAKEGTDAPPARS